MPWIEQAYHMMFNNVAVPEQETGAGSVSLLRARSMYRDANIPTPEPSQDGSITESSAG